MKENYIYPAIFSKGEEGATEIRFVDFPDILTYSETDDIDDVVRTAQDILALTIMDYEAEKRELPDYLLRLLKYRAEIERRINSEDN